MKNKNIKKYRLIMQRYQNKEFGNNHLSLNEILTVANEPNLLDKMSISEVQELSGSSSGMMKWVFATLQKKKEMEKSQSKSLARTLTKK